MAVVVFDYEAWAARYPELASSVDAPTGQLYFNEATLYLDNTDNSIVQDVTQRAVLLNMLVAHIAFLNAPIGGSASSPLVGRISDATEGTVSVRTELSGLPGSAAWYSQSKYGLAYWQATINYRNVRYVRPRRQCAPLGYWPYGRC